MLIFNISHTSQLEVAEDQLASLQSKDEERKSETFAGLADDASSQQTYSEVGGAIGATHDELGFFRCKTLDLAKLVVSKTHLESFRKYIYFKYVFLVGGN